MKKYLVTEINVSSDFNQPRPQEIRTELPPNGKWLTREEVLTIFLRWSDGHVKSFDRALDEVFGEEK